MSRTGLRFTLDGSDALEAHLQHACDQVLQGVRLIVPPARLQGLLLGGGYGRGEGGVWRALGSAEDRPYNDLEFYVFVRGSTLLAERAFSRKLHHLGTLLSGPAGVDVEFKVISVRKLRRSRASMFYYDLVSRHRRVLGPDDLLQGCDHHRRAQDIPLAEATRLLMNRCSGLLFSVQRMEAGLSHPSDADFVGRNLAKAQLGLGDVLLASHKLYDWSCLVRRERLQSLKLKDELAWAAALRPHHATGVEFKLHPVQPAESPAELASLCEELTALAGRLWLWLECRRLGIEFSSMHEYARSKANRCPESYWAKNWLVTARSLGLGAALSRYGARYPRERLLKSLALLLFEPERLNEPEPLQIVQRALNTRAATLPELTSSYRQLWTRFN